MLNIRVKFVEFRSCQWKTNSSSLADLVAATRKWSQALGDIKSLPATVSQLTIIAGMETFVSNADKQA